ncbi:hypothetical protein OG413_42945 [Streptomyces sp. NBC_01433]|uniref:hypothetical protein n=1 Tax=Streptomyces sp. NBC_01433 TaxID=2903864 RepID=UPI00225AA2F7|nr:hypothetical protein [Streptomyces sp. NBC_01433]MCX4681958.1 hypothetical protein [Streptomyces sp. NBC_01433]
MDREEELLRGRVYGADHDRPVPLPHRDYAELVGGTLDGLLLDALQGGRVMRRPVGAAAVVAERPVIIGLALTAVPLFPEAVHERLQAQPHPNTEIRS